MSPQFVDTLRDRARNWLWTIAWIWLCLSLVVVLIDWFGDSDRPGWITKIYFHATLFCSILTFTLYGWDKRQARRDKRRIQEKTLHRLAAFGGWPGAILGQQYFRHKTVKASFRLKSGLILGVHLLIIMGSLTSFLLSWF